MQLPGQTANPDAYGSAADWKWTAEPWEQPDADDAAARTKLDALRNFTERDALKISWLRDVVKQPKNPHLMFRWAYAERSKPRSVDAADRIRRDYKVMMALRTLPPPYTYDMSRIRFIYECSAANPPDTLIDLGKRLLAVDRSDEDVQTCMIELLENRHEEKEDTQSRAELISMLNDLCSIGRTPIVDRAESVSVYWTLWKSDGKTEADRRRAITECKSFLAAAAPDDYDRAPVLQALRILKGEIPYK